jgi:TRAP-type C4-dicarboxylate transport system permease small subunit
MLHRITAAVMSVTQFVAVAAFSIMITVTLLQVVNRYAIGMSLFWTEELVVLLLVWSMLLGMPVQLWRHQEIVVDVLPLHNTPAAQNLKLTVSGWCSIVFCAILAWSGVTFALRGLPVSSPALGLPRFWFFVPIPLSAVLAIVALLVRPKGESVGGFE